uniref:Uncharacterized protein n=1 Tax=Aegilops tauschii subsp. strangulata TaxID=200361 RepID=A0A453JHL0_AEGTS
QGSKSRWIEGEQTPLSSLFLRRAAARSFFPPFSSYRQAARTALPRHPSPLLLRRVSSPSAALHCRP